MAFFLFLLFFYVVIFVGGLTLALGGLALFIAGCLIVIAINLAIRFWYLVAIAIFIMIFPVLYLEGWLGWILVPIIVFAVAMWFIPVPDEQKADYEKAKAEFKASRNSLTSKS
ncbi:hypothetical protein N8E87_04840 [Avibacterium paragallinarum]|uniref:hypothetical protein n=1 Tax=Avibacterium paragallinarum TaxID=728 RepID=UPI0021F78863|nr:hypothetical protein [Avibacterium paragallinarum]UXN37793.1 hypothetical protein N8E87_04840 [Avibacterium paragallinarum]